MNNSALVPLVAAALCLSVTGCASRSPLKQPVQSASSVRSPEFQQLIGSTFGPNLIGGNRIQTLSNGDQIFPAMLAAIRGARRSINFETFVYYDGDVPQQFADALAERARAGVKVNVLVDAVGAAKSRRYHAQLKEAGVELGVFHPLLWFDLRRANFRTHRKLLIVDGRIGFTGGVGIADDWRGDARSPEEWRDLHYRIEGPIVAQLQGGFSENWLQTRGILIQGPEYYPRLTPAGTARAATALSSPWNGQCNAELLLQVAVASARQSLLIEHAYFLPDSALADQLCQAAQRGVKVQVVMPGDHIDQKAVRRASRRKWSKLLAAGVELYEYHPTMNHTKLLIVDALFVSVGSTNFDPRSLRINDELNLNVLDEKFAREQTRIFEADRRRSKRITDGSFGIRDLLFLPHHVVETPLESNL